MAQNEAVSSGNKREYIIEAASSLITEMGVENTSLARIAKETGISKGTLYYYYSSKSDLIFDVTDRHMDNITTRLVDIVACQGENVDFAHILKIVYETLLNAETRTRLHLYLVREAMSGDGVLKERFLMKYRQWKSLLVENMKLINDDIENTEILAELIVATVDGLIIQAALGEENIDLDSVVAFMEKGAGL